MASIPAKLFIDASAFIALIHSKDRHHQEAVQYYTSLQKSTLLLTTVLVVSETYTWLRYRVGFSEATQFLDIVTETVETGWMRVVYPDPETVNKAHGILRRYPDQKLSYADAVSIAVMEKSGVKDAFTFDVHFLALRKNVWPGIRTK